MAKVKSLSAVHVTVIKRFKFLEPVFEQHELVRRSFPWVSRVDYGFLGDARQIEVRLNRMKDCPIKDVGILKPIRNPNIRQEFFWAPFRATRPPVRFGLRRELPMYPFQILPNEFQVTVKRDALENLLGFAVIDYKVTSELRVYPPGIGTVHFHLYLRPKEQGIEVGGLANLASKFNKLPVIVTTKSGQKYFSSLFAFFDYLVKSLCAIITREGCKGREVGGHYIIFNLQGEPVNIEMHAGDLARLLAARPYVGDRGLKKSMEKVSSLRLRGRHKDDLLIVSNRRALIYVDKGIWEQYRDHGRPGLLEGRRCFRHHFVNAIELAYATEALVSAYKEQFRVILSEVQKAALWTDLESTFRRLATSGILDPCAYGTLVNQILNIPQRLSQSRADGFWTQVFSRTCAELRVNPELQELRQLTTQVYDEAVKFTKEHRKQLREVATTVGKAAERFVEAGAKGVAAGISGAILAT